jgi:hypothetical protein
MSHLQNFIGDCKKCQGTTSVVPGDDQKDVGLYRLWKKACFQAKHPKNIPPGLKAR